MTALDLAISAGGNDAGETAAGTVTLTNTRLELISSGGITWAILRFLNVTIPQGSTIDAAYVSLLCDSGVFNDPGLLVYCEAADNSAAPAATTNNISGRSRTASVSWTATDIPNGSFSNSPSLITPVQAVINRAGWASGNALSVLLNRSSGTVRFSAYENGDPPRLHIDYTAPAAAVASLVPSNMASRMIHLLTR
jgi:hypothetical protein